MSMERLNQLRQEMDELRQKADELERKIDALAKAETATTATEHNGVAAPIEDASQDAIIFTNEGSAGELGPATTELATTVYLRMNQVPTSICHLLDKKEAPLLSCTVKNLSTHKSRRLRLISYIEGYSAQAISTFEVKPEQKVEISQLPDLLPERIRDLAELTRATLYVEMYDLEQRVQELSASRPVWLLARTAVPFAIQDPKTDEWNDMSRYFGAFITPNAPNVLKFLHKVVAYHPTKRLVGYPQEVGPQVRAVFNALKAEKIAYVSSILAFSPDDRLAVQRVRLPRETLEALIADAIDGTVLFASLLEAISLNPAIVVIPAHAFVGWETGRGNNQWNYLETTRIGDSSFEEACQLAEALVERYESMAKKENDPRIFQRWSLRELRTKYRITPLE